MRAYRHFLTVPTLGLALAVAGGCGPSGGGAEKPAPKAETPTPAPTGPGKTAATTPAPTPAPAPVDKKFQEDATRIAAEVGKLPPSPAAANEGLEAAEGWKLADWEDPGQSRKVEIGRGGNALAYLATAGGPNGKSALVLTRDLAIADKGSMRLAVYNPGAAPVRIAAAFWFGDNWVYYESKPQDVESRAWKTLAFDLAATDFKTPSSKWEYRAGLWKRENTKQLAVLLFAGGKTGAVFLDGLAVDLAPAAAVPERPRGRPEGRRPGPQANPEKKPEAEPKKTDDPKAEKKEEPKPEKKEEPKPEAEKKEPPKAKLFGEPPPEEDAP